MIAELQSAGRQGATRTGRTHQKKRQGRSPAFSVQRYYLFLGYYSFRLRA